MTLIAVISLSGCSGQNKSSSDTASFRKNFLQVKNFQLKITKTAVIPAGETGN